MAFLDRPSVPLIRKICCFAYILASMPIVLFSLGTAAIGRCDSDGCLSPASYFLIFPGLIVALVVGGILLARWAVKDDD